ncbi:hypothetical protein NC652_034474 [Populus alba x Populus x berolinensis]|uniref:Uncharacterized protein n=1 Tax=Populus alba x Populus x berolinensis TaxID=444605 RepID=A0AAD6LMG3_9ROSI|nr:hypothetical protein NC652_034474 [Populus alba x Populus x berolinensis]KAJ6969838.1 hypothetical protein NC653_034404 [Populus alba x Populus x berolinensis]
MGSGPLRGVGSPRLRFGERAYLLDMGNNGNRGRNLAGDWEW